MSDNNNKRNTGLIAIILAIVGAFAGVLAFIISKIKEAITRSKAMKAAIAENNKNTSEGDN